MRYLFLLCAIIVVGCLALDMYAKKVATACNHTVVQHIEEANKICFDKTQCTEFGNGWVCKIEPK
jgi:Asp-tRNA(Asn)/Glu-tRNA(Gln) amidotransferase A subunit family amidase